jgi:HSP20 family protein
MRHQMHPGRGRGHRGGPGGRHGRRPQYGPRRPKHNVPVNIQETATGFEARIYCVGFAKEDVQINLLNDMIYISGTRKPAEEYPDFLLQEYPIKSFERWFQLSEKVDQSSISASFEDGILVISAPKTVDASQPEREVKIK